MLAFQKHASALMRKVVVKRVGALMPGFRRNFIHSWWFKSFCPWG